MAIYNSIKVDFGADVKTLWSRQERFKAENKSNPRSEVTQCTHSLNAPAEQSLPKESWQSVHHHVLLVFCTSTSATMSIR